MTLIPGVASARAGCPRNRKDMRHASFSSGTALEEPPAGGRPETEREHKIMGDGGWPAAGGFFGF